MNDEPTHRNDGSNRRGMAQDGALRRPTLSEGIRKGGINPPPPRNIQRPDPPAFKPAPPPPPKKD
jgi:hypothetical protein